MATANLAWVAWREGKNAEAEQHSKAALELWQSSKMVYPFQWAALWPIIGVSLAHDQLGEAVDHARPLLAPQQQSLPKTLNSLLEAAIRSWDAGQLEAARTYLGQATPLAQEMGYL